MSEMSQKEEYLYIIKNHDIQKLINDSNLPEFDKNIIKERVLSNDVDLSEKLKILNYLLKYQRSEYYRGQIIYNEEKESNEVSGMIESPGYYLLELSGGNGGSFGSSKDSISLKKDKELNTKKSIRNFIIQSEYFKNEISDSDLSSRLYFTTDFKWFYVRTGYALKGDFELNNHAVFLHLKGETFEKSIRSDMIFQDLISLNYEKRDQKFYDYSSIDINPKFFEQSSYKKLNFKTLGTLISNDASEYKTISLMDGFGYPPNLNLNEFEPLKYPNLKNFIDDYVDLNKYKFDPNNNTQLPQSCSEKEFPLSIKLNQNFSAGGSGSKLIKILKIKKKVYFKYKVGRAGDSSFNADKVSDGEKSYMSFYANKDDESSKLFSCIAEGGKSTINGNDAKSVNSKVESWSNDSIDFGFLTDASKEIDFSIGPKSFRESSFDYNKFDGKSYILESKANNEFIEEIDKTEFFGSEIKGQGMNLTDFETVFYQDAFDGQLRISFLGPISSNSSTVEIEKSDDILSSITKTEVPKSSTIKILIKILDQSKLLNLKTSYLVLVDKSKKISLYDLVISSDTKVSDTDFNQIELSLIKDLNYYTIITNIIDNYKLILSTDENVYLNYDASFIGTDKEILSITSSNNEYLTLQGTDGGIDLNLNYKNIDYKVDEFINSLYNKEKLEEDFESLNRKSKFSNAKLSHNNFLILNNLKNVCQLALRKGNTLHLESIVDHNNNEILPSVEGSITNIEYTYSIDGKVFQYEKPITCSSGTVIYIKVSFNTSRVRISKSLSGISSENTLYPKNFDPIKNKQIDPQEENFQYIKYICNESQTIILNLEANTFKLKLLQCLYSLFDYKTIDNKENYEYGEEVILSFVLKNNEYISLRDIKDKDNDYLIQPSFKDEMFESSIIVGKNKDSKNTIRFGYRTQYDDTDTFIEKLRGVCACSRDFKTKDNKNIQNVFFATMNRSFFIEEERCFIYFRMPENDIKLRLTLDFLPISRLCEVTSGEQSLIINKEIYIRNILSGGRSGNGGSGFSLSSNRRACRAGGCGASGFVGGSAGNGSSCTDWGVYFEGTFHQLSMSVTKWSITWSPLRVGLTFGVRSFAPGAAGAAAPGFKTGGKSASTGSSMMISQYSISHLGANPEPPSEATLGARTTSNGDSFINNKSTSMYRGRLLDYCAFLEKTKKEKNSSLSLLCVAGNKGTDGLDGLGISSTEDTVFPDTITTYVSGFKSGEKILSTFNEQSLYVKLGLFGDKYGNDGWGEAMGSPANGGAGAAGLPSMIKTNKNANIKVEVFNRKCRINLKSKFSTKAMVSGGGVDGFSMVEFSPYVDYDDSGISFTQKSQSFTIWVIPPGFDIDCHSVKIPTALRLCEAYPDTKDTLYEKYILAPYVIKPENANDIHYVYSGGTRTYSDVRKYFGIGGGKSSMVATNMKDYTYKDFLSQAGYSGKIQKIVKDTYADFETVTFPPNINEAVSFSKKIDFKNKDQFLSSLDKIENFNSTVSTVDTWTSQDRIDYLNLDYQTSLGSIPNEVCGSIVYALGPKKPTFNRTTVDNLKEFTLDSLYSNTDDFIPRNWLISQPESLPDLVN